jgi:ABC-type multidrug transport system ATPase subunit
MASVSRLYGSFVALREVSLRVKAGASVVLLGENGAGKSTLLKLVAGLASPSYGKLTVLGGSPRQRHGRVAYMSHETMLYDELTGLENLVYFAGLLGLGQGRREREDIAARALSEVGLDAGVVGGKAARRVGEYSQGMRQRASLARVLLNQPELLLLDEPFSNLDAASAQGMIARLLGYLAEDPAPRESPARRTLLLTTHQAELAKPLAQMTVTLAGGRLVSVLGGSA